MLRGFLARDVETHDKVSFGGLKKGDESSGRLIKTVEKGWDVAEDVLRGQVHGLTDGDGVV
jgi:hypothetical protein